MSTNQIRAIRWIETRAAENTAHPEENAVTDYLIGLVRGDVKTAQAVVEGYDEPKVLRIG
ncbi:hypothetical protein [Enterovibrio norvegicus]|uniref:hypothetical protein n=1 Tax=Enterovibrio norvegicus TaxID=188144 RepID=UPI000CBD22B3|nr:hypothetical protein [Enterovibrio norvegicus]PMN68399.1 hypothetical protein BCT27_23645 [Enterovibrio norvegicus]